MNAKTIIVKPVVATKNFVVKHKTAILVTVATSAIGVAVTQQAGLKQHDQFLKDHDLYDEYYNVPDSIEE